MSLSQRFVPTCELEAPGPEALEILPPPPTPRRNLRRAFELMKLMHEDPTQTELGVEMVDALGGYYGDEPFLEFAADPYGRRMLREQPSLLAILSDREALAKLPDGSYGRAYLDFCLRNGFNADGLIEIGGASNDRFQGDTLRAWFDARMSLAHDLQHVLTGYGTDTVGEEALLSFTRGQGVRGPALRFITTMTLVVSPWRTKRFALQARRRGRRAASMITAPYEELLPLPLLRVREQLGLGQTEEAHPGGILEKQADGVVAVREAA